ncbi:uncharacterized protein LOC141690778 [Apium graveolens]|uniref:uncharacterized protein LOC141690778 n=1 Tax=Apium graveolens TaxID=4045 RepID=UPI003D7A697C
MLKDGMKWRVEAGDRVEVLGQQWLVDNNKPYITTTFPAIIKTTVNSLICVDKREWDVDLIRDIFNESFNERDQCCILNVPLKEGSCEDVIFWKWENNGIYLVKSGYKLLQAQKNEWRLNDEAIQLQQKYANVRPLCPVCSTDVETIEHAIFLCPFAVRCWVVLNKAIRYVLGLSFSQWLENTLALCNKEQQAKVVTLCWAIWRAQNEVVWNKKSSTVNRVVAETKHYLT